MANAIIVVNAGSTSLKFGAYTVDPSKSLPLLCHGQIDGVHDDPRFVAKSPAGKSLDSHQWGEGHAIDHKTALQFVLNWLETHITGMEVVAAGHRVVLASRLRSVSKATFWTTSTRWRRWNPHHQVLPASLEGGATKAHHRAHRRA